MNDRCEDCGYRQGMVNCDNCSKWLCRACAKTRILIGEPTLFLCYDCKEAQAWPILAATLPPQEQ